MHDVQFLINNHFVVSLRSDSPFIFTEEDTILLSAHVPGATVLHTPATKIDFIVEHVQSSEKRVLEEEHAIVIHDLWSDHLPDDIFHLLHGISRRYYLSINHYLTHGACVAVSGKNILVVGHSGAGKTSVTLELLKQNETRLFSGNKTAINFNDGHIKAVAGTPTITVKKSDMGLFSQIEKERVYEHWERNSFLLPQHRYIPYNAVTIDVIAIVKLTSYTESCELLTYPSTIHTLYPYFMDSVNADVILTDFGKVFSTNTTSESKETLVQNLTSALDLVPVVAITGTTHYIATTLTSI